MMETLNSILWETGDLFVIWKFFVCYSAVFKLSYSCNVFATSPEADSLIDTLETLGVPWNNQSGSLVRV